MSGSRGGGVDVLQAFEGPPARKATATKHASTRPIARTARELMQVERTASKQLQLRGTTAAASPRSPATAWVSGASSTRTEQATVPGYRYTPTSGEDVDEHLVRERLAQIA